VARYKTIAKLSEGFYKEKGSKFIAFAVPVETEAQIKAFIAQKRKEHHQAVHVWVQITNCIVLQTTANHQILQARQF
jgi:putative IMPACT (imprinted ancient) family translation regulator